MQFDKSVDLDRLDADIKEACAKVAARFEREAEEALKLKNLNEALPEARENEPA